MTTNTRQPTPTSSCRCIPPRSRSQSLPIAIRSKRKAIEVLRNQLTRCADARLRRVSFGSSAGDEQRKSFSTQPSTSTPSFRASSNLPNRLTCPRSPKCLLKEEHRSQKRKRRQVALPPNPHPSQRVEEAGPL